MLSAVANGSLDVDAVLDGVIRNILIDLLQDQRTALVEVCLQTKLRRTSDDALPSRSSLHHHHHHQQQYNYKSPSFDIDSRDEPSITPCCSARSHATATGSRNTCSEDRESGDGIRLEASDNYDDDLFEEYDGGDEGKDRRSSAGTSSSCWNLGPPGAFGVTVEDGEDAVRGQSLLDSVKLLAFATYDNTVFDQQQGGLSWDRAVLGDCSVAGFTVYVNELFEGPEEDGAVGAEPYSTAPPDVL